MTRPFFTNDIAHTMPLTILCGLLPLQFFVCRISFGKHNHLLPGLLPLELETRLVLSFVLLCGHIRFKTPNR